MHPGRLLRSPCLLKTSPVTSAWSPPEDRAAKKYDTHKVLPARASGFGRRNGWNGSKVTASGRVRGMSVPACCDTYTHIRWCGLMWPGRLARTNVTTARAIPVPSVILIWSRWFIFASICFRFVPKPVRGTERWCGEGYG